VTTPTSQQPGRQLGLRERKKLKLRRDVQAAALRLFEAQGYEQTTVEQIAAAADTSTTTFYRYFPTKEDVVLDDEYDPLMAAAARDRPRGEPLADTLRAAVAAMLAASSQADQDQIVGRLRLIHEVPALRARYADEERRNVDMLADLLVERTGRPRDDYQLELTAAMTVAALFTASRRWASGWGVPPLADLLDQAMATIEPVLARL
jgi:AcrR family transcriptional regulator